MTAALRLSADRPLTFPELVALEPQLGTLYREAKAAKDDGTADYYCANAVWFGYGGHPGIKPRLRRLVGWDAHRDGVLATSAAYDVAYDALYDLLPCCRGYCGCL